MPPKAKKQKLSLNSETEIETMSFMRRSSKYCVGVHVSAANGLHNAIINAHELGCNSFSFFLKNQRTWNFSPIKPKTVDDFKSHMKSYKYEYQHVIPHGSYLINLGNKDAEKREKSYKTFIDDLKRCEMLDIELYNFHPGSTVGECSFDDAIYTISECINNAIEETSKVIIVIENMAGQGHVVGSKFEELAQIIERIHDKSRIGICIDTCHAFAAGYDLRTEDSFKKVFKKFDDIIGFKYLKALHLNDSKGNLGCRLDKHENLGKGKIGLECFKLIMNDKRFENIPLIIETPAPANDLSIYKKEIELLYALEQK